MGGIALRRSGSVVVEQVFHVSENTMCPAALHRGMLRAVGSSSVCTEGRLGELPGNEKGTCIVDFPSGKDTPLQESDLIPGTVVNEMTVDAMRISKVR